MGFEKIDAWVNAIRLLARQNKVSHRTTVGDAIKEARKTLMVNDQLMGVGLEKSLKLAIQAGIPENEIRAVYALIFQ